MYRVLYYLVLLMLFLFLIVVPLAYCIRKGEFNRGFLFTWITWAIVLFVWELVMPAFGAIVERATGKPPDIMMGWPLLFVGVLIGWLPGFVFGVIGGLIHKIVKKCNK
jgi:hypothetical protein